MELFTKHSTANNSTLKIIATVVFIALPIMGFILGMQYQERVNSANQEAVVPLSNPSISKKITSGKTWKTYTNAKYGYSVDYPPHWQVREFPSDKAGAGFQPIDAPNDPTSETIIIDVTYKVMSDPPEPSFEAYAKTAGKEIENYGEAASFEKVMTASGLVGYKATWYMGGRPLINGILVPTKAVRTASGPFAYFEVPGNNLRVLQLRGDAEKDVEVYNQMLKTIRFSDLK